MKRSIFIMSLAAVLFISFSANAQEKSKRHGRPDDQNDDNGKPQNVIKSAPNVNNQHQDRVRQARPVESRPKEHINQPRLNPQSSRTIHQPKPQNVQDKVPANSRNSRTIHQPQRNNAQNNLPANSQNSRTLQPRSENAKNNVHGNSMPLNRRAVSPQLKKMGVRSYPKPMEKTHLLAEKRERSTIVYPKAGPGGASLKANAISRTNFSSNLSVRTRMSVVNGASFKAQINQFNRSETTVGSYYWHTGNGYNYCHYYDPWGYHWYGWYWGNSYFWTRWYSNNWWWYDPTYYRWCYWHDGGWWWQDPNNVTVIYVYKNGNYEAAGDESESSSQSPKQVFQSDDGTREVRLVGDDAFLYDTSGDHLFKPVYLDSNVTSVKFSNTSNGKPLQVLLMLGDGSFETFDDQGYSLNGAGN